MSPASLQHTEVQHRKKINEFPKRLAALELILYPVNFCCKQIWSLVVDFLCSSKFEYIHSKRPEYCFIYIGRKHYRAKNVSFRMEKSMINGQTTVIACFKDIKDDLYISHVY